MLLQRSKSNDALVDGTVMYNLAELSLLSSEGEFDDIITSFSESSRVAALSDENHTKGVAVLTAQTKLANNLAGSQSERAESYLTELLQLFVNKGLHVQQNTVKSGGARANQDLLNQLIALLPVIDNVLAIENFEPHVDTPPNLVVLFRNVWFLIILFGFLSPHSNISDWQRISFSKLAVKTPCLLRGTGANYVESDLAYNSVLRSDFPQTVRFFLAVALVLYKLTCRASFWMLNAVN